MSVTTGRCECRCHNALLGNYQAECQLGHWHQAMILSADPTKINGAGDADLLNPFDAAAACSACVNRHSIALSGKPWDMYGTPWSVEKDEQDKEDEG